jgi:hypothetical protein
MDSNLYGAFPVKWWFDACLTIASSAWLTEWVQAVRSNRDKALAEIAQRSMK